MFLKQPIDKDKMQAAKAKLYEDNPQLKNQPLDLCNKDHQPYIHELKVNYIKQGGAINEKQKGEPIDEVIQECLANKTVKIVDLLYDPTNEDIYLIREEDLALIEQETAFLENIVKQVYDAGADEEAIVKAKDNALQQLTNVAVTPVADKTILPWVSAPKTETITEVIRLTGKGGYKYLRTDHLKKNSLRSRLLKNNHSSKYSAKALDKWRSVDMAKADNERRKAVVDKSVYTQREKDRNEQAQKKAEEKGKPVPKQTSDKPKEIGKNGKVFDYKKLNEELKEKIGQKEAWKFKLDTGNILPFLSIYNPIMAFCNEYHDTWEGPSYEGKQFSSSLEAQFFRFSANASASAEVAPSKGVLAIKGQVDVDYAFGEGRARFKYEYPDKDGWHAEITVKDQHYDLGYFLLRGTMQVTGYAGASACLCGGIEFDVNKMRGKHEVTVYKDPGKTNMKNTKKNRERRERRERAYEVKQQKEGDQSFQGATASAQVFFGVRAGNDVKGGFYWLDSEENYRFLPIAEIGASAYVAAGFGAEASFYLGYDTDKQVFYIKVQAGIVFGPGLGGGLDGSVNPIQILRILHFVRHCLYKAKFQFLNFIDKKAYSLLIKISVLATELGRDIQEIGQYAEGQIKAAYQSLGFGEDYQRAQQLATNILNNPDGFYRFTPPEGKGKMLAILCQTFVFRLEEDQEDAILKLLSYTDTKREFSLILKHMSLSGEKISEGLGLTKLYSLLDFSQEKEFNLWRTNLADTYRYIDQPVEQHTAPWRGIPLTEQRKLQLYALQTQFRQGGGMYA